MKKILLVILLLVGIILPTKIYALEDSFKEAEYIPDAYIKKFRGSSGKYEQMKAIRRNSDNRLVYCIELWETVSSNKQIIGYDNNQSSYASISSDTWNRIMLIAYYGYGYQNHTDIKWYAITQFMIWQETSPDSTIYFTDTLNGNQINKYESEMSEINNLINEHYKKPTFTGATYEIPYNQRYSISDSNKVLPKYDIVDYKGMYITRVNNLTLTIIDKNFGTTELLLRKSDKIYSNNPTVYIDNSGQNLLLAGSFEPIDAKVYIKTPKAVVIVNKKDKDTNTNLSSGEASLSESVFEILDEDNNVIERKKVNNKNQAVFNLDSGTYKLREVVAGTGYKLNDEIKIINPVSQTTSIDFYNEVIKGKIRINKYLYNSITDRKEVEKDAQFVVLDKDLNEVTSFKTDDNGYAEIELPYGNYTIKQVSGLKNYKLSEDINIEIKEESIQEFNLIDEILTTKIKITNIDSDSLLPILESGASFKIKDKNNIISDIVLDTNNLGTTDEIILPAGSYIIEQQQSVNNYILNKEILELEINEDNYNFTDTSVFNINIANDKEKSKIEITKTINYYLNDNLIDTKKDNNINATIYAKEDIYSKDGIKLYEKDKEVDSKELVYGNYYIKSKDGEIVDIKLDSIDTREVNFLESVYNYTNNLVLDIPNTYIKESIFDNISLVYIYISLVLIYRSKKHEN